MDVLFLGVVPRWKMISDYLYGEQVWYVYNTFDTPQSLLLPWIFLRSLCPVLSMFLAKLGLFATLIQHNSMNS